MAKKAATPKEDQTEVMLSVRVPRTLRNKARKLGIDKGTSLARVVVEALERYLKAEAGS